METVFVAAGLVFVKRVSAEAEGFHRTSVGVPKETVE
jgi:hypothetical protein